MALHYYTIPCLLTPSIIQIFPQGSETAVGAYEEKTLGVYTASNFKAGISREFTDEHNAILFALSKIKKDKAPIPQPSAQTQLF